jgi:hypothetical protein
MQHAHIDISRDLEGEPVVFACFDLRQAEVAAAAHAVRAVATERFRTSSMSADEVLQLRELTALADELDGGAPADLDGSSPAGQTDGRPPAGRLDSRSPAADLDGRSTAGELDDALRTTVFRPARLSTFREAVARFVESRDEAEWIRDEDREPLALLRSMLLPLEQLCAEAMRVALSPGSHAR